MITKKKKQNLTIPQLQYLLIAAMMTVLYLNDQ